MIVQVIGVSGCGKSTIAKMLSNATGIPYYDADDFHPKENVDKMSKGEPLNDNDRAAWLHSLSEHLREWEKGEGAILACSALKERYRQQLDASVKSSVWVFLSGDYQLIYNRMKERKGHYMGEKMLKSQFDALEVPAYGIHIDINNSPEEIVNIIKSSL